MTLALQPGSTLLHYRIVAPLGAGGMGEVYRAVDSTLGREVAIKVLPTAFASDGERLARFEREARLLASLNHPNIAAVYGLHELAGNRFLAMELVPGEDLAHRLENGALPVDEALAIARQIADALAAAHEQGVVHRDLKPANVQVTADGRVKVLDFGLAKGLDVGAGDLAHSPTLTFGATVEGVILGTAAYMSPEQARGRPVDRRADVWAFGCVLWEMLTGRRLFGGETVSDTIAAVLRAEPDWNRLPDETPAAVRRLLRRCLERDPAKRLRDLGDARLDLDEPPARAAPRTTLLPAASAIDRRPWAIAGLSALIALAALVWALTHRAIVAPVASSSPIRFTISDPPLADILHDGRIAISPDGSRLFWITARAGRTVLVNRSLATLESQEIPGSEDLSGIAAVAADGASVAITRGRAIEWLALRGGAPLRQAAMRRFRGAALALDGALWFSPATEAGILRAARDGGEPTPIVLPDPAAGERSFRWPTLLPGGEVVLFTVATIDLQSFAEARIEAYSTRTKRRTVVVSQASYSRFLPPDRLLFMRAGGLFEGKLDLSRLTLVGEPRLIQDGVADDALSGLAEVALAADGTLAYVPGGLTTFQRQLLEIAPDGTTRPIAAETRSLPTAARLARRQDAGARHRCRRGPALAARARSREHGSASPAPGPTTSRSGDATGSRSSISPCAASAITSTSSALDGGEPVSRLDSDFPAVPIDVSPDGARLLFRKAGATNTADLWELPLDGASPARSADLLALRRIFRQLLSGRPLAGVRLERVGHVTRSISSRCPGRAASCAFRPQAADLPRWRAAGREIVFVAGANGEEIASARVDLGSSP